MELKDIASGFRCFYTSMQEGYSADKCKNCKLLPPYYYEDKKYSDCLGFFTSQLEEYVNTPKNKRWLRRIPSHTSIDEIFGEDDRIWENGIEIK